MEGAIGSKFRNNGQTCVCANRIYVQAGVYDEFAARLVDAIRTMKVGDGFEDGVTFGPLIEQKAVEKVRARLPALGPGSALTRTLQLTAIGPTHWSGHCAWLNVTRVVTCQRPTHSAAPVGHGMIRHASAFLPDVACCGRWRSTSRTRCQRARRCCWAAGRTARGRCSSSPRC